MAKSLRHSDISMPEFPFVVNKKLNLEVSVMKILQKIAVPILLPIFVFGCSSAVVQEAHETVVKKTHGAVEKTPLVETEVLEFRKQVIPIIGEASEQEKRWGIRIVGIRTTMAGMMINFRYRIMDPVKASPLLDINKNVYLVVEETGAKLGVPHSVKIGALRQTTHAKKVKKGFDYYILFGNPGRKLAKPGDKLAVVIGENIRFDNLTLIDM